MAAAASGATVSCLGRQWSRAKFPKMVVFDVDYTLWPYWVDTHTRPPYMLAKDGSGKVWDSSRQDIVLFEETAAVLLALRELPGLKIAYASRTGQPTWLESLAKLIQLDEKFSMWQLPDYTEIYPVCRLR
eukprot:SAG31_NODE_10441_length_1138_cov_1.525505_1_plen_130_part_00